jgi:UrcA family protein
MKLLATLVLVLSSAAAALPAFAGQPEPIVIDTRDINLASAQGVEKLDGRIRWAIRAACPSPTTVIARERARVFSCHRERAAEIAPQRDMLIARARGDVPQLADVRE